MAGINQIRPVKTKTKKKSLYDEDSWLVNQIDNHLEGVMEAPRTGVFYPSALGNPCDRYLWLCYNGKMVSQTLPPNLERIFQNGSSLEDRVDKWLEEMNILVDREVSVKQDIPPISGRIDFLINHYKYGVHPIELKSINTSGFYKLKSPKPEHEIQLQIYLNIGDYNQGTVFYENKNDQKMKTFVIERDIEKWNEILIRCFKIQDMLARPTDCTGNSWCACKKVGAR